MITMYEWLILVLGMSAQLLYIVRILRFGRWARDRVAENRNGEDD